MKSLSHQMIYITFIFSVVLSCTTKPTISIENKEYSYKITIPIQKSSPIHELSNYILSQSLFKANTEMIPSEWKNIFHQISIVLNLDHVAISFRSHYNESKCKKFIKILLEKYSPNKNQILSILNEYLSNPLNQVNQPIHFSETNFIFNSDTFYRYISGIFKKCSVHTIDSPKSNMINIPSVNLSKSSCNWNIDINTFISKFQITGWMSLISFSSIIDMPVENKLLTSNQIEDLYCYNILCRGKTSLSYNYIRETKGLTYLIGERFLFKQNSFQPVLVSVYQNKQNALKSKTLLIECLQLLSKRELITHYQSTLRNSTNEKNGRIDSMSVFKNNTALKVLKGNESNWTNPSVMQKNISKIISASQVEVYPLFR